jgi:hypothetical protein
MKEVRIIVRIDEVTGRMATAFYTKGYNASITNQLEILGILENLAQVQKDKIKIKTRITPK